MVLTGAKKTLIRIAISNLPMKLAQFQHYLQQTDLDMAYFCHPDPALTYFTQFYPSQAVLLVGAAKTTLFLSKLDNLQFLQDL